MKRFLLTSFLMGLISVGAEAQMAQWSFEGVTTTNTGNSPVFSVGTGIADAGSQTTGSLCSAFHTDASTVWSNPVGNGSTKSISSNRWAINDYYQFLFDATGYQDLSITWDATGSNTGPRDFKVQYSTNGTVFTDATGINSTYQLTGEAWSSTTYNPASTRTLDLNFVTALNNSATVYIRLVVTSTTSIGGGVVATGGTSRVDNFNVNGSSIPANTITITGLSSTTFNLPDCFTTASGTVDFTSTDVFNGGNVFTAQLSDAAGSFATPTNIGSLPASGTNPGGTISITIPNGTASGTTYKIRIVSSDPIAYSNLSPDITINQLGTCVSSATDYFRSRADGSWNSTSTWESSPTGTAGTWIPATLTPTSGANTITIQNTHTVTVTLAVTVDQVVIQNGGILIHSVGVLTINDDASGDDIIVQNGGIFTLSFLNNPPVFSPSSATGNINTGGTLRVSVGGMTAAGAGVNTSNYIYQNASILELTTAFTTNAVTYFPNANAVTIPIFRSTGVLSVGAAGTTTINGVFEAASNISFINSGDKIFRNGIRGVGNINGSTSGGFFITGVMAELGGAGSLILPTTGLVIGSASNATTVTLITNKTVTGDISLLSTNNTYVDLGTNYLTVSGTISGGASNAFIRTGLTSILTLEAISTSKTFPIGYTTYNPLVITTTSGNNFSARVEDGINPVIGFPTYGINRTWNIYASVSTPGVNVTFQYAGADANAGAMPQPQNMEILINTDPITPGPWSIIPGNTGIFPGGADPYTITTATSITIATSSQVHYALGKDGGWILPIDCIISTRAQKRNNTGIISWTVNSCADVTSFEVQRSVNNSGFQTIGTIHPGATETDFRFTDLALGSGRNLYRIKVNRLSGSSKYSNTVAIIHNSNDILISSLAPNPVHDKAMLTVSAGRSTVVDFKVFNMSGSLVIQWQSNIAEGNNIIEMKVSGLPAGMYTLFASGKDVHTVSRFVKQ